MGLSAVGACPDQAEEAGVGAWEHHNHGLMVGAQGAFLKRSPRCVACRYRCDAIAREYVQFVLF